MINLKHIIFLLLIFYSCAKSGKEISVYAGSITKIFLDEINRRYEEKSGTKLLVQYGGSGIMLMQFIYGKGEVYISTCDEFMEKGVEMEVIEPSSVFYLSPVHPAIIVRRGEKEIKDFNTLISRKFGIANPKVCTGKFTEEIFRYYGKEELMKKAKIQADSLLSLTTALLLGSVDGIIGLVELKSIPGIEVIPLPSVSEPRISIGLSKRPKHPEEAWNYLKFLLSSEGKEIMKRYGFQPY